MYSAAACTAVPSDATWQGYGLWSSLCMYGTYQEEQHVPFRCVLMGPHCLDVQGQPMLA